MTLFTLTFARGLAERVAEIVPAGFSVFARGRWVTIVGPDGLPSSSGIDIIECTHGRPLDALMALVATNVLDLLQDTVTLATATAWPRRDDYPPGAMDLPFAVWSESTLIMGYGRDDDASVRLRPWHMSVLRGEPRARPAV